MIYLSIPFLGSILRNSVSIRQAPQAQKKHFVGLPSEVDIQKQSLFYERPHISLPIEREALNPDGFIDIDAHGEERTFAASFVSINETLLQREIIFQPPIPEYPEDATTQQELKTSFVIFKIYVSDDGLVEEAINVCSCGNPEIDAALARYIRRWRFAPVAGRKRQIQTIKIDLDLNDQTGI